MGQILLIEEVDLQQVENEVLLEQEGKVKNYFISGPYLQGDVKNGNGRVYPFQVLVREAKTFAEKKIPYNQSGGELKHPETTEVDPDRISHIIKELRIEDKDKIVYGKAKVIDSPCGRIVKTLMDEGVRLGVSSRGVGTLKESVVQNDYKLVTVDIVTEPSGPACFVEAIIEGKTEWVIENGILTEKEVAATKQRLDQYTREDYSTAAKKVFEDFLAGLKGKK